MTPPEFSRPVRIDTLGEAPRTLSIEANEAECEALARRFGLQGIETLRAKADLSRRGESIRAAGALTARVTQSCVGTGLPVPATVQEAFHIEFRPHPASGSPDEEVELGEHDLDVVFYDGASVDFGEAVAETLSLALDPYPRAPNADAALAEVGVKPEGEEGPRGALAGLKDLLGKPKG